MFNPVYPFTNQVLHETVKRGCKYFVRNKWPHAFDHFDENIKGYFIISHYDDKAKAQAHYNAIPKDPYRFLYDWEDTEHREKLKAASLQPEGYKIYSTYFIPDFQKGISSVLKDKINDYMYKHTNWKPKRGETVNLDFFLQFGCLYATMNYGGKQLKVKFEDIEKSR